MPAQCVSLKPQCDFATCLASAQSGLRLMCTPYNSLAAYNYQSQKSTWLIQQYVWSWDWASNAVLSKAKVSSLAQIMLHILKAFISNYSLGKVRMTTNMGLIKNWEEETPWRRQGGSIIINLFFSLWLKLLCYSKDSGVLKQEGRKSNNTLGELI